MRKIWLYAMMSFVLTTTQCKKEKDAEPDSRLSATLLTGIHVADEQGQPLGQYGNANVRTLGQLYIYPNPFTDVLRLSSPQPISKMWLLAATPDKQYADVDFDKLLKNYQYTPQMLSPNVVMINNNVLHSTLLINTSDLDTGYYRVFVQLSNDSLYWDNVYCRPTTEPSAETLNRLVAFWQ